ncbi:MAG TPA: hypothetical protein VER17_17295 [Tepidisphaeraceae bacterium]|nr:hypothetical protein [Tepidisphaeraceae bacterium]
MNELTDRQAKFLDDYAFDQRTMDALLEDHGVSPRELREWRRCAAFRETLQAVEEFHDFRRECDIRKGAWEHVRRSRQGVGGENRALGVRQAAAGRDLVNWARKVDPHLAMKPRTKPSAAPANPIHPRFAHEAPVLLARMEALHQRAEAARRQQAQSPAANGSAPAPAANGSAPAPVEKGPAQSPPSS